LIVAFLVSIVIVYLEPPNNFLTRFQPNVEGHCRTTPQIMDNFDCRKFIFDNPEKLKNIYLAGPPKAFALIEEGLEKYAPVHFRYNGLILQKIGLTLKKSQNLELIENTMLRRGAIKLKFNQFQKSSLYGITEGDFIQVANENEYLTKKVAEEIYRLFEIIPPRTAYFRFFYNDKKLGIYELTEPFNQEHISGLIHRKTIKNDPHHFKVLKIGLQRIALEDSNIKIEPKHLISYILASLMTGNIDDSFFGDETVLYKINGYYRSIPHFSILFKKACELSKVLESDHFSNSPWIEEYQDLLAFMNAQSPAFRGELTQNAISLIKNQELMENIRQIYSDALLRGQTMGIVNSQVNDFDTSDIAKQIKCSLNILEKLSSQNFESKVKDIQNTPQDELSQ
jgi:hypothetical protein